MYEYKVNNSNPKTYYRKPDKNRLIEKKGKFNKVVQKKARYADFVKNHLDIISFNYDVSKGANKFFIIYGTPKGTIDYYPGADKINIHNGSWIVNGLDWIKKNLIND